MSASSSFFRFILSFRASASRRATWIFCWMDSWFMSAMLLCGYRGREGVVSWCRGGRVSESGDAGKSRGPRRERSSPGHRDTGGGSRRAEAAMATGARGAAAIACTGRSMGAAGGGVVVERTAGAGRTEVRRLGWAERHCTSWGQRKLPCLPEYRNNGLRGRCQWTMRGWLCNTRCGCLLQYALSAIIDSSTAVLWCCEKCAAALLSRPDEEGARNLLQRTSSFARPRP